MTISFLIPIIDDINLKDSLKEIIDNISVSYPKGKTEIVLLIVSKDIKGVRTIDGPPIIKIRHFKSYAQALNEGMEKALGDFVVFSEVKTKFSKSQLTVAAQSLENCAGLTLFLGDGWQMLDKIKTPVFPGDIFCLKTFLILYFLVYKYRVVGGWGQLHRIEVLRFLYKMDKIKLRYKLRILWGRS